MPMPMPNPMPMPTPNPMPWGDALRPWTLVHCPWTINNHAHRSSGPSLAIFHRRRREGLHADQAAATADARIKDATFGCGVAEPSGHRVIYRLRDCAGHFIRRARR
jgi:hypothetical protein